MNRARRFPTFSPALAPQLRESVFSATRKEREKQNDKKQSVSFSFFALRHHHTNLASPFFPSTLTPSTCSLSLPTSTTNCNKCNNNRDGAAPWRTRTSPTSRPRRPRESSGSLMGTGGGKEIRCFFCTRFLPFCVFLLLSFLLAPPSSFFFLHLSLPDHLNLQPTQSSEVAKFCQKYLASRVRAHDGFTTKKDVPRALADCFHEIDSMLASEHHAAELEAMRAPPAPPLHLVEFGSEKVEDGEMENALKEGGGEGGGEALARQCPTSTSSSSGQEALPDSDGSASASASASGSMAAELRSQSEPALAAATTTTTQRPPPPPPRPPPLNLPPPEERVVAGCTAVVAAVVERTVYVANAGDSRAVLCNGAGRARPLSVDHKPAAPAEAARIRAAGGFVSSFGGVARVNGNLSLSRAIGDLQYKGNDSLGRHEQVVTVSFDFFSGAFFRGQNRFKGEKN